MAALVGEAVPRTNRLASTFKRTRLARRMSQQDVADLLDASQGTIDRWERGAMIPRERHVVHFAQAFELDADELLEYRAAAIRYAERKRRAA